MLFLYVYFIVLRFVYSVQAKRLARRSVSGMTYFVSIGT